ncbi:helix-turn-helix transcriptional regulator [Haloglycomyces albus]|uniref:helix-turn-helix transcriptional regulator n=1 Tax=Haloglycomyces albus TaxID=526067 RepID=UPI00146FA929|nr:helix-turn-helix domain-containing protein [Haloglycomyces albus]
MPKDKTEIKPTNQWSGSSVFLCDQFPALRGENVMTATAVLPALMIIDDLAQYLSVAKKTIYDWNCSGTGPTRIKVGGSVRYRASDIESWIDSNTITPLDITV